MALEMVLPSLSTAESIDWESRLKVDPEHIAKIRIRIEESFPRRKTRWGASPYPTKHLECLLDLGPRTRCDEDVVQRYNPYSLRLPYALQAPDHLLDQISSRYDRYVPAHKLEANAAQEQYLNLIREYHLLYVDFLEAINGSTTAIARIAEKVEGITMYQNAGLEIKHLKKGWPLNNDSVAFRQSCAAYIGIDVLRAPTQVFGTAARVRALEVLHNLGVDDIASHFSVNSSGFQLPYRANDEPVEDLIPRSFMSKPEEKGGTPHNDLFFRNAKIQEIFAIQQAGYGSMDERWNFDAGLAILIKRYPAETVQTLLSVMRSHAVKHKTCELAFHALCRLCQLDPIQKGELFGSRASYRAGSQHGGLEGLQSRIGATTGAGAGFGDGLDSLSPTQLRTRLRQMNAYVTLLEGKLADGAMNQASMSGKRFADPEGYFQTLGLTPSTPDFDILVHACYRTLALRKHPDKGGKKEEFQRLERAYSVLKEPGSRETYMRTK